MNCGIFLLMLLGLIITGGHDNLILVWSIESLGRSLGILENPANCAYNPKRNPIILL
jgi:hypothetical protein